MSQSQEQDQQTSKIPSDGNRLAKVIARAGLCSRRDAEQWILQQRVSVNGTTIIHPAHNIMPDDRILVDGKELPNPTQTRLWRYHKPKGLVTTHKDPQGRSTVFNQLPHHLPRVISIGRLDANTEGLLLLTNDGQLARFLEHPSTGWKRRYKVRAFGRLSQDILDTMQEGITIDSIRYAPIEAVFDRQQGNNLWLTMTLREGKNREIKKILQHFDLKVNRLIRISYGPFMLGKLPPGETQEIKPSVLREHISIHVAQKRGILLRHPR